MPIRHLKFAVVVASVVAVLLPLRALGLLTATAADDELPGVYPPASPVREAADWATDKDDVFRVDLEAGQWLYASMTGAAGTDFDMYVFGPGTSSVNGTAPASAYSEGKSTSSERILYRAKVTGPHYLDIYAFSGVGTYALTYGKPSDQPSMTVHTPSTVAWGSAASIVGTLAVNGAPVPAAPVRLYRRPSGQTSWTFVSAANTGSDGSFTFSVRPDRCTSYRLAFIGDQARLPVTHPDFTISPFARLPQPSAPLTVRVHSPFLVSGFLTPRHPAGVRSVSIVCYRQASDGGWVYVKTIRPLNVDYSSYTRYYASATLDLPGRWRLVSRVPADAVHLQTSSAARYVTVSP